MAQAHIHKARFAPGTVVRHRRFGYRGLIFDVDAMYSQSPEWYDIMLARTRQRIGLGITSSWTVRPTPPMWRKTTSRYAPKRKSLSIPS